MLTITLRDLQFRKRQFAIAIIGAGLTFALALLLTGVSAGFDAEAEDTIDAIAADGWVVEKGVSGPFTSLSAIPVATEKKLNRQKTVEKTAPFVALSQTMRRDGELVIINVNGVRPGGLGAPEPDEGTALRRPGEAVVDTGTGAEIGSTFTMAGKKFRVVGELDNRTYLGGQPVVYTTISDAQDLAFEGRPLANAILFTGNLESVPRGFSELTNDEVEEDMKRPLKGATKSIDILRLLMWIVAAVIIGAVIYLSALERLTDFAVLKAVGGESRSLAIGLSLQAILASVIAAGLAAAFAVALRPAFPLPVTIRPSAYLLMVVVAVLVGVLSSLAALRRVLRVDPALAFG